MTLKLSDLVKDQSTYDVNDICSDWLWLISEQTEVLLVTVFGDMFLVGPSDEINWLDTGAGKLTRVANSVDKFQENLGDEENIANWFMTDLYLALREQNIAVGEDEVYSYKTIPSLGGQYSPDNFEPTNISVHFSMTGQIHEKIKDLPPGTEIGEITIN